MKLDIKKIIEDKLTYPSWSTGNCHRIKCKKVDSTSIEVYYEITQPIMRKVSRNFPKFVNADSGFIWLLGFLKGEGANSKGKSNYRRFTLTNTNPSLMKYSLYQLGKSKLINLNDIPNRCFHIIHAKETAEAIKYWSTNLNMKKTKFQYIADKNKTSKYGVCHMYISDVLLRRVVDELNEYVMSISLKK